MNRVDFDKIGGFPLELDDFIFEQAGHQDAFKGIISSFNPAFTQADSFQFERIFVEALGGLLIVESGYIALGGEIVFVPIHVITDPGVSGDPLYWQLTVVFDANGNKLFEDGGNQDTYEIRTAILTTVPVLPSDAFVFDRSSLRSVTWADKVQELITDTENTWTKTQHWTKGTSTQTQAPIQIPLANNDGNSFDVAITAANTVDHIQLIGEGTIIALNFITGTQSIFLLNHLASAPPAGFGRVNLGASTTVSAGETLLMIENNGEWVVFGSNKGIGALNLKADKSQLVQVVRKNAGASLGTSTEDDVFAAIAVVNKTSSIMVHTMNIELVANSNNPFTIRWYIAGGLVKTQVHDGNSGDAHIVTSVFEDNYSANDTLRVTLEFGGPGSSFVNATLISLALDAV